MNVKLIVSGSRPWELWMKHWGLSLLINDSILFDTFINPRVLFRKRRRAKIDFGKIKTVIISHDHSDHTGGLWEFLEQRKGMDVYVPAHVREATKSRIRSLGGNVIDAPGLKALDADIHITDEIMGTCNGKPTSEQAVVLKTVKGLVVVVGCSHPGIVTIVKEVKQAFGAPVYGVIGGFHLRYSSMADVRLCANTLKEEGVGMVVPLHCTGWRAERIFKDVYREGFVCLREGQTLSL